MADDVTHYDAVEAYCDRLSYLPGDVVGVHVWCAADKYDIDVRRWGGEVIWSADGLAGVAHDTPDNADSHGCGWPIAVSIPVATDWRSGMYLVTLRAHGLATPRGSGAFTVYRNDHWMFEGTGLRYGDQLGRDVGAVGYETVGCRLGFDDHQLPIATPFPGGTALPSHMEVVAFTPSSNLGEGDYPASIAALGDQCDLEFIAQRIYGSLDDDALARARYGNAVMLTCKPFGDSGGTVATIGSTDWVYGLNDPLVAQVTANVMRRLC